MTVEVGSAIPALVVVAKNTRRQDSRERELNVHDDGAAQKMGFERGVVAGSQTAALIGQMLLRHFGTAYITTGTSDIRFVAPVFEDETLTTGGTVTDRQADGRLVCEVWIERPDGSRPVVGTATVLPSIVGSATELPS